MAVLTKDRLVGHGQFVDFAELSPQSERRHIASFSEPLLDTYCSVTNNYLPFDPHLGGELDPRETRALASNLLQWAAHIARCRLDANDVSELIELYLPAHQVEHVVYQAALEELRQDLVDTATFLATNFLSVAKSGNKLAIEGI